MPRYWSCCRLGQYHTVAMSTCEPALMLLIPRGVQGIVIAPRTRALSRQLRTNGAQPLIPGAGSSIKLQNIPTHYQVKQASKGCGTRDAAVNVTDCWLDALTLQKFHCYAVQINASSKLLLYKLIVSSNRPVSPISGVWSWYNYEFQKLYFWNDCHISQVPMSYTLPWKGKSPDRIGWCPQV